MTRTVNCRKYKEELPGLERPPYPGAKGEDIYNNVSKKAWDRANSSRRERHWRRRAAPSVTAPSVG